MGLGNNLSSDDLNRVHHIKNPPSSAAGFESDSFSDSSFDDIFDISDDDLSLFGSDSSSSNTGGGFENNPFAPNGGGNALAGNNPFAPNGGNAFGQQNGLGGNAFGQQNGFGLNGMGGFNTQNNINQTQQAQPDLMDSMIDASIDASKSLIVIIGELIKSIKLRNVDDYGYLGACMLQTGGIISGGSVLAMLVGHMADLNAFKIGGIPSDFLLGGLLTVGTGLVSMGASALVLSKKIVNGGDLNSVQDIPDNMSSETDLENNIDAVTDDIFGDDFDDLLDDFEFEFDDNTDTDNNIMGSEIDIDMDNIEDDDTEFNPEGIVESIQENQYINRELLFNTFKTMFPFKTPKFADKKEIDKDSELFLQIETACLKSIANIQGCDLEDVTSSVEKAWDSLFSYEIKLKRVRKMNKTDDLARELEVYFRDNSTDIGVNASVDIEGDFYKIVITKGVTAIVTFGDIFKQEYCKEFFLNTKNKLPIISGITELGEVILNDAKVFDTMLVAGKPRSGKSWYILSILMSLMLFNTPYDVQFVIVDPKESNLFKTMALMPHVCGLHNDKYVLDIMDDLIKVEAPRRKKLLSDHKCDDIWALRSKGINLPILYLVIDEYITVRNNLGDDQKELDKKLQTIISQLPSLGIRLIFVPHRATGVVDKTNRTMLQFTACVKSDPSEVTDTLDIKKWNRPLVNPGDIAIKTSVNPNAKYVRGAALTTDDNQNTDFIRTAAKVFYKMGVDLPDMITMTIACNRDNNYIRSELSENGNRLQFNASNILNDI